MKKHSKYQSNEYTLQASEQRYMRVVYWDMKRCGMEYKEKHFREVYCLHLQGSAE